MIIGVDKNYYIVSVGVINPSAFSNKVTDYQELDLEKHNYKYVNGRIVDLGLKKEFTLTKEERIKEELQELDNIINRATEDLYTLTELTPYKSTQDVINRKIELRDELKILQKGEM